MEVILQKGAFNAYLVIILENIAIYDKFLLSYPQRFPSLSYLVPATRFYYTLTQCHYHFSIIFTPLH